MGNSISAKPRRNRRFKPRAMISSRCLRRRLLRIRLAGSMSLTTLDRRQRSSDSEAATATESKGIMTARTVKVSTQQQATHPPCHANSSRYHGFARHFSVATLHSRECKVQSRHSLRRIAFHSEPGSQVTRRSGLSPVPKVETASRRAQHSNQKRGNRPYPLACTARKLTGNEAPFGSALMRFLRERLRDGRQAAQPTCLVDRAL